MFIKNDRYEILTEDGFKDFKGLKVSQHKYFYEIEFQNNEKIKCSKNHLLKTENGFKKIEEIKDDKILLHEGFTYIKNKKIIKANNEYFYDPVEVEDTSSYLSKNLIHHNCDEAAYIPKKDWDAFADAVFPTMASLAFKQTIITSTANGMNHFAEMVNQAKNTPEAGYRFVSCDWREVPRVDKQGNIIPPEVYKKQIIRKYGLKYFLQTEANEFLGSSDTLVNGETLKRIQNHIEKVKKEELPVTKYSGLNTYKLPERNKSYIISVDTSKDGIDDFSINVIDISQFPFEQVADANLQVDYLIMPEYLEELGKFYNNALIIIENNEGSGQSIADTLWNIYEYENLYRDKNIDKRPGFKRYPGFRTTPKSRSVILGLLRAFLEENKLILNSETSLKQLYTFTKNDNEKYVAEDGYKDDSVMSLAIAFAPFMESIRFDDYELFINELRKDTPEVKTKDFMSVLDLAFDNEDIEETEYEKARKLLQETNSLSDFDSYGISESILN